MNILPAYVFPLSVVIDDPRAVLLHAFRAIQPLVAHDRMANPSRNPRRLVSATCGSKIHIVRCVPSTAGCPALAAVFGFLLPLPRRVGRRSAARRGW
jgi:hypothetical protein